MKLYPAMDLINGKAVRLVEGQRHAQTAYDLDPLQWAMSWAKLGAKQIHLVSLSAAFDGQMAEADYLLLQGLSRQSGLHLQYGGGLRTAYDLEKVLDLGCDVVVGTVLIEAPPWLDPLLNRYPRQLVGGVDAKDGLVKTHGWTKDSAVKTEAFMAECLDRGWRRFVYTDISRDGRLNGPNLESLKALQSCFGPQIELIASGGVSTLEDLDALAKLGLYGAISGKALLEGRIDPKTALSRCEPSL